MKVPSQKGLIRANRALKTNSERLYRRLLAKCCSAWARISGDQKLLGLLRSRDFPGLYSHADALVAQQYPTAALHFAAHQTAAMIRKYPWDPSVVRTDPERTAFSTFMASERRCARMNRKFRLLRSHWGREEQLLARCRGWIRYVIRDEPDLPSIFNHCDFTGGASLGVHGNATNLARKLQAPSWSVTPSALPLLAAALGHNPTYAFRFARKQGVIQSTSVSSSDLIDSCKFVQHNKIAFVPKTAKTFRSIAVEPLGNGYLQKGTDEVLRLFLRRIGIDLRHQSPNQELARKGSLSESEDGFCTIDLSSASDSIATEVVRDLLPPDWFVYLNQIRSPSYEYSGVVRPYEKFCSMGNGFCFPLETLLFSAICHAVCGGKPGEDWRVYGDDIIVRKKFFPEVLRLLKYLGFKPNSKKTFGDGPFRESCGSNWYLGEDVTPFTLDFALTDVRSMFKFANLARRNTRSSVFLRECVDLVIQSIPDDFLFWRPFKGAPDTGIDQGDLEFTPRWRWNYKFQCPSWLELSESVIPDSDVNPDSWVVMAAALRGHPSERPFTLRNITRTRVRVIARSGDLVQIADPVARAMRATGVLR